MQWFLEQVLQPKLKASPLHHPSMSFHLLTINNRCAAAALHTTFCLDLSAFLYSLIPLLPHTVLLDSSTTIQNESSHDKHPLDMQG